MSAVLPRSPSGPRTEGDDYQNLVAWNKALTALIGERDVVAITVERPASGNVDDVVIAASNTRRSSTPSMRKHQSATGG